MHSLRNAALILLVLVLTGCAASVRYAPRVRGIIPGYVDQRLGEDTYRVKIGEAWPKDWQDLEKFAIYRAAELTQKSGQRYFSVLDASSRINSYTIPLPVTSTSTGTVNTIGAISYISATTTTTGGGATTISGGWYTLDFRILTESDLSSHSNIVDSQQVMRDLKYFIDDRR